MKNIAIIKTGHVAKVNTACARLSSQTVWLTSVSVPWLETKKWPSAAYPLRASPPMLCDIAMNVKKFTNPTTMMATASQGSQVARMSLARISG